MNYSLKFKFRFWILKFLREFFFNSSHWSENSRRLLINIFYWSKNVWELLSNFSTGVKIFEGFSPIFLLQWKFSWKFFQFFYWIENLQFNEKIGEKFAKIFIPMKKFWRNPQKLSAHSKDANDNFFKFFEVELCISIFNLNFLFQFWIFDYYFKSKFWILFLNLNFELQFWIFSWVFLQ